LSLYPCLNPIIIILFFPASKFICLINLFFLISVLEIKFSFHNFQFHWFVTKFHDFHDFHAINNNQIDYTRSRITCSFHAWALFPLIFTSELFDVYTALYTIYCNSTVIYRSLKDLASLKSTFRTNLSQNDCVSPNPTLMGISIQQMERNHRLLQELRSLALDKKPSTFLDIGAWSKFEPNSEWCTQPHWDKWWHVQARYSHGKYQLNNQISVMNRHTFVISKSRGSTSFSKNRCLDSFLHFH
jgi:hypothetical protein